MPKNVYVGSKGLRLSPNMVIGQGGEAVIYRLSGNRVLKLYMEPNDPAYAGNPEAQAGATLRLQEVQSKLPAFPTNLPAQVVAPQELAYEGSQSQHLVGYTMPFLDGANVLLNYSDRKFRETHGIDANQAVALFRNLHRVVSDVHSVGVVIGDFNDLNVLVDTSGVHLVDADSMQFGRFPCRTFTARFVDPLLCGPDRLVLQRPHNPDSDWYGFVTMLFQSLLYINPYYGGVHKPKTGLALRNDARVLKRLTVMSPEVIYPKVALPLASLPDELLDYFSRVYEHDKRGPFPLPLLENLRWTSCSSCGLVHARAICPACAAPGAVKQVVTRRGTVTAALLFRTTGRILFATRQGGELRYLYHEGGAYKREGDHTILNGLLDGDIRFRLWHERTILAKGSTIVVLTPSGERTSYETETVGRLPIVDANQQHMYWLDHGRLVHDGRLAPVTIGATLEHQTLLWVGQRFGFGFYRAGALTRGFVFDAARPGLNDSVPLPVIRGNLIDAACSFADHLVWFMLSLQDEGVIRRLCFVVSDKGELIARTDATQGDGSWLGEGIRGRLAIGSFLYAATDAGIVRITLDGNSTILDREFPDTEPFVGSDTQLLPDKHGLIAVSAHDITLLHIH